MFNGGKREKPASVDTVLCSAPDLVCDLGCDFANSLNPLSHGALFCIRLTELWKVDNKNITVDGGIDFPQCPSVSAPDSHREGNESRL